MLKLKRVLSIVAIFSLLTINLVSTANASSLTSASDKLSDSDMNVTATHTVSFKINTALAATDYVDVVVPAAFGTSTFTTGCFGTSTASYVNPGTYRCTVTAGGIATSTQLTMTIANLKNPAVAGSQTITISSYASGALLKESANVMVAVISNVDMSASVPATLTFTIAGVASNTPVNAATTTVTSSSTALAFGNLQAGTSSVMAQQLSVTTNANNGYSVTVQQNQNLTSNGGSQIATFANGTATTSAWSNPTAVLDATSTYGHMGITSNDWTLAAGDTFGATSSAKYTGFNGATPVEVLYHNGAADGLTLSKGTAKVAFRIQISALQPAGDYSNILTYIATPNY